MAEYKKSEAKEWAKENFRGIENVLMPSFKPVKIREISTMNRVLRSLLAKQMGNGEMLFLDEAGIRHDVQMCITHGFYASTVSVEGIYYMMQDLVVRPYYQIVKAAARGAIILDAYIGNNTFDENVKNIKIAEEEGMDCVMVVFPPSFYPQSEQEVYAYFEAICDSTQLAIIAYPSHKYNFERFHPSRFSPQLIEKIADIENVVAMKLGVPNLAHNYETWQLCGHKVLLNSPVISWWPFFVNELGAQWAGSSPFEYLQTPDNPRLVRHFDLLLAGKFEEAMQLYWEMTPVRDTFEEFVMPTVAMGNYNIMHWKYMGWLTGMNGGPIPLSTTRLYEHEKVRFRAALRQCGITPREPDKEFYVGRVNYQGNDYE